MSKTVQIWTCEGSTQLPVALSLLQDAGIDVVGQDGTPAAEEPLPLTANNPAFDGAQIWVREEDAEAARELLDRAFDDDPET